MKTTLAMPTTTFDIHDLPMAAVPYPVGIWDRTKYIFWRTVTPHFLRIRGVFLKLHLIHHHGRQSFIVGRLSSLKNIPEFIAHLQSLGFGNHFIAWQDSDQLVSLRRLDGFGHQYHLRIFKDGELRGHYEYTPEAHPIWHLTEHGMEERHDVFLTFLRGWIAPRTV